VARSDKYSVHTDLADALGFFSCGVDLSYESAHKQCVGNLV